MLVLTLSHVSERGTRVQGFSSFYIISVVLFKVIITNSLIKDIAIRHMCVISDRSRRYLFELIVSLVTPYRRGLWRGASRLWTITWTNIVSRLLHSVQVLFTENAYDILTDHLESYFKDFYAFVKGKRLDTSPIYTDTAYKCETFQSQFSNTRRTQSQNITVSRPVLLLSLPNPLKPGVKLRMKM